jgi:hypothetical protein
MGGRRRFRTASGGATAQPPAESRDEHRREKEDLQDHPRDERRDGIASDRQAGPRRVHVGGKHREEQEREPRRRERGGAPEEEPDRTRDLRDPGERDEQLRRREDGRNHLDEVRPAAPEVRRGGEDEERGDREAGAVYPAPEGGKPEHAEPTECSTSDGAPRRGLRRELRCRCAARASTSDGARARARGACAFPRGRRVPAAPHLRTAVPPSWYSRFRTSAHRVAGTGLSPGRPPSPGEQTCGIGIGR